MFKRSFFTLILATSPLAAQEAHYLGSFRWMSPDQLHGGFSGLELSSDGMNYTVISDGGSIDTGHIVRDENGVVLTVESAGIWRLPNTDMSELRSYKEDAEGLAIGPKGSIFVSFEGDHRLWSYGDPTAQAQALPKHPNFKHFQNNSGMEALAIDADGHLLTLPERSGSKTRPFPVFRFDGRTWEQPFSIPRRGEYLPVGMDIDADGRLYLLERWFRGIGFSSRVRRFDLTDLGVKNEVELFSSRLGSHDNLEGIAVWKNDAGTHITMISDDNFKVFQITEFVDYLVPE